MGTFDVKLKKDKTVVFPAMCVVCEKPNPDGDISLSILGAETGSFLLEVADLDGRGRGSNTDNEFKGIPACKGCSGGLKTYHRLFKLAQYTGWIPGLALLVLLKLNAVVGTALILLGVIVPPVLTLIFPPAFGATVLNDRVNFEFTSQKVAEEFKRLNEE